MPKLSVFPKAFMQELCVTGTYTLAEWITQASTLGVDGLEWYAGFLEMKNPEKWVEFRKRTEDVNLEIPMLCCSPDFTHPNPAFRSEQVQWQKHWIDMTAALGGKFCRVLSGQRRPGVSVEEGLKYAKDCIEECLVYAKERGIVLVLENHYKDDFWRYPEFAQKQSVFLALVKSIHNSSFGVNYDPSNAYLAGEDPVELLGLVLPFVKTMHASDRYLVEGSLEDLKKLEGNSVGYASLLKHGEVGKGLNNYDLLFSMLAKAGFDSWISIEDGVEGMEQLQRSVDFVRGKINEHWKRP